MKSSEDMTDGDDDLTPEEEAKDQLLDQSALDVKNQKAFPQCYQIPRVMARHPQADISNDRGEESRRRKEPYGPDGIPFCRWTAIHLHLLHMLPPLGCSNAVFGAGERST
jgi:hypothetical protein